MARTLEHLERRQVLRAGGILGAALAAPAWAQRVADLGLPGGPSAREFTTAFPEKGEMILQRTRPPLLETPMSVFDQGIFTPNDRFYVRWHWSDIPTDLDPKTFRLAVHGQVRRPLSLALSEIMALPHVELAAVNQCSGNSRGVVEPRVAGAEWAHGAMGNALWRGVRLRDVLDRAGVLPGAVDVRMRGLDKALVDDAPSFAKSLAIDHAMGGEVLIAFAMNGARLPMLNGFPLRLIVPGWFSTYWIKTLSDIEVLDHADDGYWMAKAYRIPDTPFASVAPGATGFATVPINRMVPRAWVTSIAAGTRLPWRNALPVGGIAMGGDRGVAKVELSVDGGRSWTAATLGPDHGQYSFRRFDGQVQPAGRGPLSILARCTNSAGVTQPMQPNWNPGGYMRACVETISVTLV